MTNIETDLLAAVENLKKQQLAWTRDLVAIPTVNPYSGDSYAGCEEEGQRWYAEQCRKQGGEVRMAPVPEDVYQQAGLIGTPGRRWEKRENVIAEWQFGKGGPTIILNSHMDTVGADGMMFDPFDPRVEENRIYGRGTSDSKGNLIIALTALAALKQRANGLNGRIIIESVVDEECNGSGAGTLACCLAGITADLSICLDGSAGTINNGCNGIITPKITVFGKGGHSSINGGSVNAIDKAVLIKQAMDDFAEQRRKTYSDCMVNLGIFRAGTLPAIVPDVAELQWNISYAVEEAQASIQAGGLWNGAILRQRIEEILAQSGSADPWLKEHPARVEWLKDSYPFFCPADDALSQSVIQTVRELTGENIPVQPMSAWFDASHLSTILGKPVLGIGSGTLGKAHSADEYADLEFLYQGTRNITLAVYRLLS